MAKENERLKYEMERKDRKLGELSEEKEERAKRHLQEIENLKLGHQQEMYVMKRMMK